MASLSLGAMDYDFYEFEYSEGDAGTVLQKDKGGEALPVAAFNYIDPLNSKTYVGGKNTMVRRRIMLKSLYCTLITWRRVLTASIALTALHFFDIG
jgi:hypothetical protein